MKAARVKRDYATPTTTIMNYEPLNMIASSNKYEHICSDSCKFWHLCRDREIGKMCYDKKY